MLCPYFPHTQEDLKQMLDKAGAVSLRDLFADVPEEFIYKGEFNLPDAMSEMEVLETFRRMESR
jgi:glycine dehydrogenase subunit 1